MSTGPAVMSAPSPSPFSNSTASAIRSAMQIANLMAEPARAAQAPLSAVAHELPAEPTSVKMEPASPADSGAAGTASIDAVVAEGSPQSPPAAVAKTSPRDSSTSSQDLAAQDAHVVAPHTAYNTPVSSPADASGTAPAALVKSSPESSSPAPIQNADYVPLEDREFVCMNDEYSECCTGQYTLVLSRKVISDHFGRNKACTRDITDWPLFCRKHYQRATYNQELWQLRKIDLILRQFDVIEAQFPGTVYEVVLKKSEEARLNAFSRKVASGMSTEEAIASVNPRPGKAFEAPIDILRELQYGMGPDRTITQVKETVNTIKDMLHKKETTQVPSIEFLPQLPGAMSRKNTPKKPTRVSSKGSVRKPSASKKR